MVLLVQEMKDLQRKFHLKLLSEQKGLDNEIKGIKIIEVENMEKYIEGGEILLTSFFIYESCTISQYETHIQNLIDKGVSGFIIKNSGNIKNFLIDHQAQGEKYNSDNSKILDNFSESIGKDFVMYFEIFSIICVPVYL